ncbi:hypothetical protein DL96DRAFT_1023146 [Flagelloscypha sp. PMI_526]|nr:hypothetical protein DL96DRAFT_1023146 [Flagelloscypha sp. PMI_526]
MSEDGEIGAQLDDYDPAYEWPTEEGDGAGSFTPTQAMTPKFVFRLVAALSSCLKATQRLAILDAASLNNGAHISREIHVGRDVPSPGQAHIPRIRLKELAVSKHHATIYWDRLDNCPKIVDAGSKHGTFLNGKRLSLERTASLPYALAHKDELVIGSTTFHIHLHSNAIACDHCSEVVGESLIPLEHVHRPDSLKRKADALQDSSSAPRKPVNSKKVLMDLKRDLLSRHSEGSSTITSNYNDRAAKRRALIPSSSADAPGRQLLVPHNPSRPPSPPPPVQPTSAPAIPLPASNIGFKLLMKQGWTPGHGLSQMSDEGNSSGEGRKEPIELKESRERAGLGLSRTTQQEDDRGFRYNTTRGFGNR